MGNPIRVISPDGASGTIDEGELESALAQGFRAETADDVTQRERAAKYGDRGISAFAAGTARGATLGLTDYVASRWSPDAREGIKGLQEFNPGESFAGEVVGGIGAAFVPGSPVAMVGRAGRAVEGAAAATLGRGVLGRAGAKAIGGAAEGVITGAAQEVSRAAVEDAPLDAEKVLMGIGINALMGGAFAGGTSLAGSGASRAATAVERNIAPEGVRQAIGDYADLNLMKAAGFIQKNFKKIRNDEEEAGILRVLRETRVADDAGAPVPLVESGDNAAQVLGKTRRALTDAAEAGSAVYDAADAATNNAGFNYERLLGRFQSMLDELDPIERQYVQGSIDRELSAVIHSATANGGMGSFSAARELRARIDDTINHTSEKINQQLKQRLRSGFRDELNEQVETTLGAQARQTLEDSNRRFSALKKIEEAAVGGTDRIAGNRQVSLTDYIAGVGGAAAGLAGGSILPVIGGPAVAIANKIARERGNSVVATTLHRALRNGSVDAVINAIDRGASALASGAVDDAAQSVVSRAAEAIARGPQRRNTDELKPQHKDKREWLTAQSDQLAKLATNPEAVTASISNMLGATATQRPELAQALAVTASRALSHLQAVIPKPPASSAIPALGPKWRATDADISRFERHYRAVSDPLSVFEDLRRGSITKEAIEALQAVYPQMTEKLRTSVLERLASKTEPLPYAAQNAVKSFLGNTQPAAKVAQLQSVFSEAGAAQPQRPTQGQKPLTVANGSQTAAQRLAGRRG